MLSIIEMRRERCLWELISLGEKKCAEPGATNDQFATVTNLGRCHIRSFDGKDDSVHEVLGCCDQRCSAVELSGQNKIDNNYKQELNTKKHGAFAATLS